MGNDGRNLTLNQLDAVIAEIILGPSARVQGRVVALRGVDVGLPAGQGVLRSAEI